MFPRMNAQQCLNRTAAIPEKMRAFPPSGAPRSPSARGVLQAKGALRRVAQAMDIEKIIDSPKQEVGTGKVMPADDLRNYAPRVVEVGCGDGGFAAWLRGRIPIEVLPQQDFVATDATTIQEHNDVCQLAAQAGIPSFYGVSANALENYLKPDSVEIILSVNPYGYGLGKDVVQRFYDTRNQDWAFLYSAMQVLRPGGCVMMLIQSNLVSDFIDHLIYKHQNLPLTKEDLYRHNVVALDEDVVIGPKKIDYKKGTKVFRYDRQDRDRLGQLLVSNSFGPRGYTHLLDIAKQPIQCTSGQYVFLPAFRLVSPPGSVQFRAFADENTTRPDIRGFNVMLVLFKNHYDPEHLHPPIYGGIAAYDALASYLLPPDWVPKQPGWDDENFT